MSVSQLPSQAFSLIEPNPGQARSRRRPGRVAQFGSLCLGRQLDVRAPLLRRLAGGRNQVPATSALGAPIAEGLGADPGGAGDSGDAPR